MRNGRSGFQNKSSLRHEVRIVRGSIMKECRMGAEWVLAYFFDSQVADRLFSAADQAPRG